MHNEYNVELILWMMLLSPIVKWEGVFGVWGGGNGWIITLKNLIRGVIGINGNREADS